MDLESMNKLRLDRRLIRRRGWIDGKTLDEALTALPDASDKVAPSDEPSETGAQPRSAQSGPSALPAFSDSSTGATAPAFGGPTEGETPA